MTISQTGDFLDFFSEWRPKFWKFLWRKVQDCQTASPCQISWRSVYAMPIYSDFSSFQNGGGRHLGFLKFQILKTENVNRVKLRHLCKFRGDRSNRCWDMVIFRFFLDGPLRHLRFVMDVFGSPTRAFSGLYHCAKFGWNQYNSFDNTQVLIFCKLGLKKPIHHPHFRGKEVDTLNGELSHRNHQKALPCAETCYMTYRSSKSVHASRSKLTRKPCCRRELSRDAEHL